MKTIKAFLCDETGATVIEYALIAGLISVLIVAGATAIGTKLNAKLTPISNNLN